MSEFVQVHLTAPDDGTPETLARALVEERLAACVQIIPAVTSTYRWQGDLEHADEVLLLAKTRADLFARLADAVRTRHPYDVPEIVATPLTCVDGPYAAWLEAALDATSGP